MAASKEVRNDCEISGGERGQAACEHFYEYAVKLFLAMLFSCLF